jgi:hypothetical protein
MANLIKTFLLSLVALIAPYFIQGLLKVVLPLLTESLTAVLSGNAAAIAAAKLRVKANWKQYVGDAQGMSTGTLSPVDDWIFGLLATTELDDAFVEKLFDQAIKIEQQFFRPAQTNPAQ